MQPRHAPRFHSPRVDLGHRDAACRELRELELPRARNLDLKVSNQVQEPVQFSLGEGRQRDVSRQSCQGYYHWRYLDRHDGTQDRGQRHRLQPEAGDHLRQLLLVERHEIDDESEGCARPGADQMAEVHRRRPAETELGEHQVAHRLVELVFTLKQCQTRIQPHALEFVELLDVARDGNQSRIDGKHCVPQSLQ